MQKRGCMILTLIMVLLPMLGITASGDVGPKSSLTVTVINIPEGPGYMDLLVGESSAYGGLDRADYDGELFDALFDYTDDGWYPALAGGRDIRIFGELAYSVDSDGRCVQEYTAGIPDTFKIIVVTADNGSVITDEIERTGMTTDIQVDFSTGSVTVAEADQLPFGLLALTIPLTLLIEGLILIAFRFSLKDNWLLLLIANILTQVALYIFIMVGLALAGLWLGFILYIVGEVVVIIIELLLYMFLMKGKNKPWRAGYTVTANLISMMIGLWLMVV